MEVILLEKIRNLGNLGDKVNVKPGYGRNFLVPQAKAVLANAKNMLAFEQRRAELEVKAQTSLEKAQKRAEELNGFVLTIAANASDEGRLYGSVGPREIEKACADAGQIVEKQEVILSEGPIHRVGDYSITIQLHTDVSATMNVSVVPAK